MQIDFFPSAIDIPARATISWFPTGHKRKPRDRRKGRSRIDLIQTIKQDLNRGGLKWEDIPELTANRVHWKQLTALSAIGAGGSGLWVRRPMSREQDHLLWISNEDGQRWVSYSEDLESFLCCALVDVCGGLYCYYLVYKVFLHICWKFDENTCTITQIMTKNLRPFSHSQCS